jgi:hypothetical protein
MVQLTKHFKILGTSRPWFYKPRVGQVQGKSEGLDIIIAGYISQLFSKT